SAMRKPGAGIQTGSGKGSREGPVGSGAAGGEAGVEKAGAAGVVTVGSGSLRELQPPIIATLHTAPTAARSRGRDRTPRKLTEGAAGEKSRLRGRPLEPPRAIC